MYHYIQDAQHFNQVHSVLSNQKVIGIDTEFVRKQTFWPVLSLIQIATNDSVYIIEPSALDGEWLKTLLLNPSILKIFHSCRQDIEALYYFCGVVPKNIFDTQIGAAFLGLGEQISYADLVKQFLTVHLPKDEQWSNWAHRPLSAAQLAYAADDARYLIQLYSQLQSKLKSKKRWIWAEDVMREQENLSTHTLDPNQYFIERLYSISMADDTATALHALTLWREQYCRQHNVIRSSVIDDLTVRQLTPHMPFDEKFLPDNPLREEIYGILQIKNSTTCHPRESEDPENQDTVQWIPPCAGMTNPTSPPFFAISPPLGHAIKSIKTIIDKSLKRYDMPRKYVATQKNITDFLMKESEDNPMLQTWRHALLLPYLSDLDLIKMQLHAQQNQSKNSHKDVCQPNRPGINHQSINDPQNTGNEKINGTKD